MGNLQESMNEQMEDDKINLDTLKDLTAIDPKIPVKT